MQLCSLRCDGGKVELALRMSKSHFAGRLEESRLIDHEGEGNLARSVSVSAPAITAKGGGKRFLTKCWGCSPGDKNTDQYRQ